MTYNLAEKTWPMIENYLKIKNSILLSVGSTEQHGPTGIIGIDYLSSWEIAKKVGEETGTLVAPPLCFGMAQHHMAFPGTMSLTPVTFIQVICELIQSLYRHGFRDFTVVNGHGGNIPSLNAAFSQILGNDEECRFRLVNWWHLPEVQSYENKHFGDKNGFHATCGEISVTQYTHPEAYKEIPKLKFEATTSEHPWPLSPIQFRKTFPDGRMGSDPSLATAAHGEEIFKIAVAAIAQKLRNNTKG
ncbi:MAG: creatininase family protein [Bdellovibrionaceae bacterium]|nr:creatininase family protein [Pseudobdellovibrionaceae bacterium]